MSIIVMNLMVSGKLNLLTLILIIILWLISLIRNIMLIYNIWKDTPSCIPYTTYQWIYDPKIINSVRPENLNLRPSFIFAIAAPLEAKNSNGNQEFTKKKFYIWTIGGFGSWRHQRCTGQCSTGEIINPSEKHAQCWISPASLHSFQVP